MIGKVFLPFMAQDIVPGTRYLIEEPSAEAMVSVEGGERCPMTRRRIKESKPINQWIGGRLSKLRRMRHMTQQNVGDILSRTDSAVSDIENGYSDITLDHLLKIAEGLKIPAAGLLLPEADAPATAPYRSGHRSEHSAVVQALADEERRELLGQVFEALPELNLTQLRRLAQTLEQQRQENISAA